MVKEARELLASVGIDSDRWIEIDSAVVQAEEVVGRGFVAAAAAATNPMPEALLGGRIPPDFSDDEFRSSAMARAGLRLRRWDANPAIAFLEGAGASATGATIERGLARRLDDRSFLLDLRHEPALIRLARVEGEALLVVSGQGSSLLVQEAQPSPEAAALATFTPPSPFEALEALASGGIAAELLDGAATAGWLIETATALAASPASLDRIAAAGLIARLWSPPDLTNRSIDVRIADALTGQTPAARALAWARRRGASPGAAGLDEVERAAVAAAEALTARLDGIAALAATDAGDDAHRAAMAWLERRDDLESVRYLLDAIDRGAALGPALADLDEAAAEHNTVWSVLGPFDDSPRLCAVAWQEPEAWWGMLALGDL